MTGQNIIDLFHTLTDDTSELSTTEELALANRIYKKICIKPYEFLKKEATGTLSDTVPYIALPADFCFIPDTPVDDYSKMVYVNGSPIRVVSFSDRREQGVAYVDMTNSRLVLSTQPKAVTYSFDYIRIPADLTLTTSPVFPVANEAIAFGMATDSFIIQQWDKAKSYANENQAKYESGIRDIDYYNSNLITL